MSSLSAKPLKNVQAFSELLFAAVIWGFGFTASIWALKSLDPISMSILRFSLAFIIGLALFHLLQKINKSSIAYKHRQHFIHSALPGFFLGMTLGFQTWGLELTSATNSGFITTLYVVLVPLIQKIFFNKKIPAIHALWVILALVGTGLMIQLRMDSLNKGDILTLICAVFAALQIIWIGKKQEHIESAFLYNCYQCLWAGLSSFLLWPFYGDLYYNPADSYAIFGFISITLGSTLLAFFLQIRAQSVLTPSVSSLIYLMESPFAALFAVLLINEVISPLQMLGGVIIFFSAFAATLTENRQT